MPPPAALRGTPGGTTNGNAPRGTPARERARGRRRPRGAGVGYVQKRGPQAVDAEDVTQKIYVRVTAPGFLEWAPE